MVPVRRLRQVSALTLLSLVCAAAFLAIAGTPAGAQEGGATGIDRVLTVGVIEGDVPTWDVPFLIAKPGDKVTLRADLRNSPGTHNLHVTEGAEDASEATGVASAALHEVTFTMGNDPVTFVCDVHLASMTATVRTTAPAGAGVTDVVHMGVNFLAYWVGLIAFALLFIVYGLTFFLFKYNETPATTDQWDRTGEGLPARRFNAGTTSILALVLAAVVIAGVIYYATVMH